MKGYYDLADKATELLNRKAVKRFEDAKNQAAQTGFDELNVLEVTRTLYDRLKQDNQEIFLELAGERYQEAEPHGEEPPDLAWLLALLAAYSTVSKVVYNNEVDRKRGYTAEGINSSTAKVTEFRRGLHYWADFTGQFADEITDEVTLKAYRDAGVKKVEWHTVLDGKECETCKERDGKIYPISAVPPKTHKRCRCWLEAVR